MRVPVNPERNAASSTNSSRSEANAALSGLLRDTELSNEGLGRMMRHNDRARAITLGHLLRKQATDSACKPCGVGARRGAPF